jgi:hypothetical protein
MPDSNASLVITIIPKDKKKKFLYGCHVAILNLKKTLSP